MILDHLTASKGHKKVFGWLVDPDKSSDEYLIPQLNLARDLGVDLVFVGGSLIYNHVDQLIQRIKSLSNLPVVLFPGSPIQLNSNADAILLLSLISGRNPDFLIGNHVVSAPFLWESGLEVIPTGYMLINGGQQTSVSYMSNTQPIPSDKPDIALATAMAGELLGLKVIYMDAGSGALYPVRAEMIDSVASRINLPILVGGGIRTPEDVRNAYDSGADVVIVGNAAENNPNRLGELVAERDRFNI